jgi:hypothetical protein
VLGLSLFLPIRQFEETTRKGNQDTRSTKDDIFLKTSVIAIEDKSSHHRQWVSRKSIRNIREWGLRKGKTSWPGVNCATLLYEGVVNCIRTGIFSCHNCR